MKDHLNEFDSPVPAASTRREFLAQVTVAGTALAISPVVESSNLPAKKLFAASVDDTIPVALIINGKKRTLQLDARVTLLDALREQLSLTGTKKGCDRGQCGACTVLLEGRRVNACLVLAAMCNGKRVTTIEGLASGEQLHPMQEAFIRHDAFQCGYCTPGQICSAVGLLNEGHAMTTEDVREGMSGNICRCGAYKNIVDAVKEVGHIV